MITGETKDCSFIFTSLLLIFLHLDLDWSTDGCTMANNPSDTTIQCSCSHLSSFTIIVVREHLNTIAHIRLHLVFSALMFIYSQRYYFKCLQFYLICQLCIGCRDYAYTHTSNWRTWIWGAGYPVYRSGSVTYLHCPGSYQSHCIIVSYTKESLYL